MNTSVQPCRGLDPARFLSFRYCYLYGFFFLPVVEIKQSTPMTHASKMLKESNKVYVLVHGQAENSVKSSCL